MASSPSTAAADVPPSSTQSRSRAIASRSIDTFGHRPNSSTADPFASVVGLGRKP